jgi:hypothetical protein
MTANVSRRRIGALGALAVTFLATPADAAPPRGEIVIVASGDTVGTITLPAAVEVLAADATFRTKSPHAVFGFVRDGAMTAGVDWYAGVPAVFPLIDGGRVPAGRTSVRVLSEAPVTITVPVRGLRGRRVVRLRTPLRGAVSEVVDVPVVGSTARSDVPVSVAPGALTLHAYRNADGEAAGRAQVFCVAAVACDHGAAVFAGHVSHYVVAYWPRDGLSGDVTARLALADTGTVGRLRQFVLSMPLA